MKSMLLGLAIGDAFGGPYEFKKKDTYYVPNTYSKGGWLKLKKGEWTDDTAMALCLAKSLIETNTFSEIDIMDKWSDWYKNGYMSSRKNCFDIGNQTKKALDFYIKTGSFLDGNNPSAGGNGTIMRLAPIVMYFNTLEEVLTYSKQSALLTHNNEENASLTQLFGSILFFIKKGYSKEQLKEFIPKYLFDYNDVLPTGYVLNTLKVALKGFFEFDNFLDGLKFVVSLGEDTDTVGAVYGSMAGGFYDIPDNLISGLYEYKFLCSINNELTKN